MGLIDRLQTFNTDRASVNDMIETLAAAKPVRDEFVAQGLPVPEVVTEGIKVLSREINRHREDAIAARLKQLDAADAADMTAGERREARAKERQRLEAQLHGNTVAPPQAAPIADPVGSAQ